MGMDQDDHSAECIVSCVKDDWPFVCPKGVQQSRNFWVVSWRWSDDPRLGREHLHRPCFVAHGFRLETPNQIFFFGGWLNMFSTTLHRSRCESPLRGLEGDRSERLPERLEDFFAQIKGGLGDHHLLGCHQGLSCEVIRKLLPDSYKHVIYICVICSYTIYMQYTV